MASSAPLRPGQCLGFMDTDHFRHRAVGLSLLGLGVILSQQIFLAWGVHEIVAWGSIRTPFFGIPLAIILRTLVQDSRQRERERSQCC
jgi:hypothetical protein